MKKELHLTNITYLRVTGRPSWGRKINAGSRWCNWRMGLKTVSNNSW